jgi:hypothetical protein
MDRLRGVNDVLGETREARHYLDGRAGLDAVAQAELLIDDRVDLTRLRVHDDDRAGLVAERVQRRAADFEVFARRVVVRDVGAPPRPCRPARLRARGRWPRLSAAALGGLAAAALGLGARGDHALALGHALPVLARDPRRGAVVGAPALTAALGARSDFEAAAVVLPLRASAARSRFEERDSLRDEAVSRPPRFEDFGALAADFAAVFFDEAADFLAAGRRLRPTAAGLKRNMADTASATTGEPKLRGH